MSMQPWRKALHEAGHIAVALCLGDPYKIKAVNIIDVDSVEVERGGCVESEIISPGEVTDDEALATCLILLGGWAAEYLAYNEHSRHSKSDTSQVRLILQQLEPNDDAQDQLMRRCMGAALTLVTPYESQLRGFADILASSGSLTRADIDRHLNITPLVIDWGKVRGGA